MRCGGSGVAAGNWRERCPGPQVEAGLLPHWLLVDGVQLAIPKSAALDRVRPRSRSARAPSQARCLVSP